MSYIGLAFECIVTRSESVLASSRRIMALPARAPGRFLTMVLQQKPRALAMLAYTFALIKLLDTEVLWFRGIAQRTIPLIYDRLPAGWKTLLDWPLIIVKQNLSRLDELPALPNPADLRLDT